LGLGLSGPVKGKASGENVDREVPGVLVGVVPIVEQSKGRCVPGGARVTEGHGLSGWGWGWGLGLGLGLDVKGIKDSGGRRLGCLGGSSLVAVAGSVVWKADDGAGLAAVAKATRVARDTV